MPQIPTIVELLEAGAHFGHKPSNWHPKMAPFIFGAKSGVHIINAEETQKALVQVCDFVKDIASRGGVVLFVGTKPQAAGPIESHAKEVGMPYVNRRWLGGTMTNFAEIKRLTDKFKTLKDQQDKGELKKYTKKEQIWFARWIADMDQKIGGIQNLTKAPEAIFIIDLKREKTALAEARNKGVKIIAICDSNVNPEGIDYVIPGNDDAAKAIELFTRLIAEAIKEGKEVKSDELGVKS